ncbi:MAG: hypothetical protein AB1416_14130, partial [Actinomycetota bacterium]
MPALGADRVSPRVSAADVAVLLAAACTALGGLALLVLPMGTSAKAFSTPDGGTRTVVESAPITTVGQALPLVVALVLAVATPLFLRRTVLARPARVAVAGAAVLGV